MQEKIIEPYFHKPRSAYIHIPFCEHICSYCDFAKMLYYPQLEMQYLCALEREIKQNYQNEMMDSIYIGGGTPSTLSMDGLLKLGHILSLFHKSEDCEITMEWNPENTTKEKLKCAKEIGVNRFSFGIQSFHPHILKKLNRYHTKEMVYDVMKWCKELEIQNVNVDFIYAIHGETIEEVKEDIDSFLALGIPHISTYSLMIEPNTILYLKKEKPISEDLDYEMYETIVALLKQHGYHHYEISNFALPHYESKHNLTYWNNDSYYGFGLGASGKMHGIYYTNTKSLTNYCKGSYCYEKEYISKEIDCSNALILGFRKTNGIDMNDFQRRYGIDINEIKGTQKNIVEHKLIVSNGYIAIAPSYFYLSNEILIDFVGDVDE